jgi:hypothetical protein
MAHAAFFHQAAGEDEGRDGEQHPALRARHHARGEHLHVVAADREAGDARDAQCKDDRHGEDDQDDEDRRHHEQNHSALTSNGTIA